MTLLQRITRVAALVATTAVTACGGTPPDAVMPAAPLDQRATARTIIPVAPAASRDNLVYASDALSNAIFIFDYQPNALKFAGYVPLGSTPLAECADKAQNVWVVTDSELLLEFAHGSTTPIATIGMPGNTPNGCAIDPTSGDLAVSVEAVDGAGAALIYKNAKGRPKEYDYSGHLLSACTYDRHGNLYVDATVYGADLNIGILPKGGSKFDYVIANQKVDSPGSMQWDGTYLDVADQDLSLVYRFTVTPSSVSVVDSISFDQTSRVGGFFIHRKRVVVPDAASEGLQGGFLSIYNYPKGGKRIITSRKMSLPNAAVISLGPKGTSI